MGVSNVSVGQVFGRLTVLSRNYEMKNSNGDVYWNCSCECGGIRISTTRSLNSGSCLSCGCLQKQKVREHYDNQRKIKERLNYPRVPVIFPPENEEWKDLPGYEEFYQISNLGRAYSKRTGKLMSIQHRHGKYCSIRVHDKNGIGNTLHIHRAVAELFVPNPYNLPLVNHKNEDKDDNWSTNLEWTTVAENNNHGTRNSRISNSIKSSESAIKQRELLKTMDKSPKKVYQYNKETGKFMAEYNSVGDASRNSGLTEANQDQIRKCCVGTREDYKNYLWSYIKKENYYGD